MKHNIQYSVFLFYFLESGSCTSRHTGVYLANSAGEEKLRRQGYFGNCGWIRWKPSELGKLFASTSAKTKIKLTKGPSVLSPILHPAEGLRSTFLCCIVSEPTFPSQTQERLLGQGLCLCLQGWLPPGWVCGGWNNMINGMMPLRKVSIVAIFLPLHAQRNSCGSKCRLGTRIHI